jgi:cell division protein FtsQ
MASDYSYIASESISAEIKSSSKIEKGLKRLLITAGIIILAELIWLFGVSPFIPFSTIEVHGFEGFERTDIFYTAGIDNRSSYISTNAAEIKEKLSGHILVESATVIKRFPDKLSVFLNPREAAAVALADIGYKQMPLYVDRHGVFFKFAEISKKKENIPVLSGFENPQLSMRLPESLVPLVESLSEMANASPELLAVISEIRIERKPWEGFELVLFPVHSSIKVRVENNINEDMLKIILLMLDVLETSSTKPEEIDFRSGIGSYRIKEQSL